MIIQVNPIIDEGIRANCQKPYPGHPNGCPNYGIKKGCPPDAPFFPDFFDLSQPVYAIINLVEFKPQIEEMRQKHPHRVDFELISALYWQDSVKKAWHEKIRSFLNEHKGYHVTTCPEAMGVNLSRTLENAGFKLEWPPVNYFCQVAIAAFENIK